MPPVIDTLPTRYIHVLYVLYRRTDVCLQDFCDEFKMSYGSVYSMMNKLMKMGYVKREKSYENLTGRPSYRYSLTYRGMRLVFTNLDRIRRRLKSLSKDYCGSGRR